MTDIVVIGAGGFGKEVLWLIDEINKAQSKFNVLGFVDDNPELQRIKICNLPVFGSLDWLSYKPGLAVCLALGIPDTKRQVLQRIRNYNLRFPNLIAPNVSSSSYVHYGQGIIVGSGSILTTHISIGDYVLINLACTIGHDVSIGNGVTISPGSKISGCCVIDEYTDIGTGSIIIPGIHIGKEAIVGAGTVVIKDVPERTTVVGNPAREIIKQ